MWGVLFSAVVSALVAIFPRLLLAFGIFAFSEAAVKPYFDHMLAMITNQMHSVTGSYSQILYLTGLNDAVRIVFSAYAAAIAIKAGRAAVAKNAGNFNNPTAGK